MKRKMLLSVLLVLVISALLFTGCGPKVNQPAASDSQTITDKFADRELVIASERVALVMDPHKNPNSIYNATMTSQVFDTLVTLDKDSKIVPSLAEKYEISPDGMTLTFYLRKGVKFTNGLEFKASDAKFSLERAMQSKYSYYPFTNVESVDIVDGNTIKINMKSPDMALLTSMASPYYGPMLCEEVVNQYGEQFATTPESIVGTGPYIVKEWTPNELMVFEANPDYFAGAPDIKKVKVKQILDKNSAVIALQTGDIDVYFDDIPVVSYNTITRSDKLNLQTVSPTRFIYVHLNMDEGRLFNDIRLRQAVAYGTDRDKANIVYHEGKGTIIDYPAGIPEFVGNPNIKTWNYSSDVEKAKQLVKEAGAEGKKIVLKARNTYGDIATSIADDLNKIGLNVEVQQMDPVAIYEDVFGKGDYDIALDHWTSRVNDMDQVWGGMFLTKSIGYTGNTARYSNPAMDDLIPKALREVDPEARKQLYAEAIKIYTNDIPYVPLFYIPRVRAYTKDLVIDKGLAQYDKVFYYKWND